MTVANQDHYESADRSAALLSKVEAYLETLEPPLTSDKLAGLDQFHVRGLEATKQLASLAGVQPEWRVLDAGCGLGGPSRFLVENYGCQVTGIDITQGFVAIARYLAERTGYAGQVDYEVGDLLALSTDARQFDLIWTQHVVMNIANRDSLYKSFRHMLKPGGKLAFYDVVASKEKPDLHMPVPWASNSDASFLLTAAETRDRLLGAGFKILTWLDVTADARAWLQQARPAQGLSLATFMGPNFSAMTANLSRNLQEGRIEFVMGVCA